MKFEVVLLKEEGKKNKTKNSKNIEDL